MADHLAPEKRANVMRGSKSKNTRPELIVRQLLTRLGFRYRLHRKDIPGRPDIAFIGWRKAIFVHGCFWHQHEHSSCPIVRQPSSNSAFWLEKFEKNKRRDSSAVTALVASNWESLTIWECELEDLPALTSKLQAFLES